MRIVDFVLPASLAEAREALLELGPAGLPLAGATTLMFRPGPRPATAVDLTRCGLSGITRVSGSFHLGAATPIAALEDFRADGWVLGRVADAFVTQQIRNQSTVGGNVARVFPWSDFAVALQALDCWFVIEGAAQRRLGSDEYFKGQPARRYQPGDLLIRIEVPAVGPGEGFGYHKQTRTAAGFSQATAAAWLKVAGGKIQAARVALGAAVPLPRRLRELEAAVVGRPAREHALREAVGPALAGLRPVATAGFTREYVGHLATVVLGDVLAQALRMAGGAS
jgi:carbon-monoxide dehydrogenase medium subunit